MQSKGMDFMDSLTDPSGFGMGFVFGGPCTCAAKGGHLEVVKWLRLHMKFPFHSAETARETAALRHFDMMTCALNEGAELDETMCNAAATGGQLEMSRSQGCCWGSDGGNGYSMKYQRSAVKVGSKLTKIFILGLE